MEPWSFLFIGLIAGIFSGLFGIGGATITIPALVCMFKFNQHQAQGTMLAAMAFPITLLAALKYHQQGYVNIPAAVMIAAGFVGGGVVGAASACMLPGLVLKRIFGCVLLLLAGQLIFSK
ncbi:MAG: sulfite exporter TauE/SafE family protein [Candidatus Omnitrophica bacterium]|nr:sulfite exporter TauE/SafE family protein [Candidatus Omnitrophota bacterium]